jgi:hypothetical protein
MQPVEKPGIEGYDKADQPGSNEISIRPPGGGDTNQIILFDRLDDVNGECDQEKIEEEA